MKPAAGRLFLPSEGKAPFSRAQLRFFFGERDTLLDEDTSCELAWVHAKSARGVSCRCVTACARIRGRAECPTDSAGTERTAPCPKSTEAGPGRLLLRKAYLTALRPASFARYEME